jgi:Ca2+-binding EF-hand superfamily protein
MFITSHTTSILPLLLLLAVIATMTITSVHSQQFQQPPTTQPLGEILHQLLDKDKNQKVSLDEVNSQLDMLDLLFNPTTADTTTGEDSDVNEYKQLLSRVKSATPTLFHLLDINQDKSLSKSELAHVTKFEKALKKGGGMRELLRDVFAIVDANADELISVDEIVNGCGNNDQVIITKIASRVLELFPLRSDADELKEFVTSSIESFVGSGDAGGAVVVDKESVAKGMKWIDDDGDGHISKKEVGKYYNLAGKKFMEISRTIKQIGPMLSMFGGMDMNGGGGGDAFKMDL